MKKIVLSIAGVMAAAAFAPEASALPAFARQTGMACTACHAQHFPVLNGFGRAFKAAGYTMMGAQEKIEGEHLSIPNALNAAILAKVRYQQNNGAKPVAVAGMPNTVANGQLQFGDEFSLFFGGRVAENIGFLFEGNTVAAGAQLLAGFKLPISYEVGTVRLSAIPFTTDALGVQYGYELSSGGVMRANRWAEHRRETSAIQYNADRGADGGQATGVALVAQNDMGFINVTKYAPSFGMGANGATIASHDMKSTYLRIAATPTVGDWAMVVGAGFMSGNAATGGAPATPANVALGIAAAAATAGAVIETKQSFFDLQAQGQVAGSELSVYLQHASAPAAAVGTFSAYNPGGVNARTATTIGADYSVIPHVLTIGAAYRNAKNGKAVNDGDNALTVTAVYDLVQNVALHLNHSSYSGSAYNAVAGVTPPTNLTTFMLEAAW